MGGGTVGLGSLARPGMDFTGGAAFGIPGYAGIGAAGLGWDDQEDFELVDPAATVSNISTQALSHHPCRPFFLVGSSNTHIYLWEVWVLFSKLFLDYVDRYVFNYKNYYIPFWLDFFTLFLPHMETLDELLYVLHPM